MAPRGAVGEFRRLALLAEADGHLRQKLQQVLKLSKEKWDDARDHALRAVVADNRMRIWYADKASMELGLLFSCRLGNVDLERPVGARTSGARRTTSLAEQRVATTGSTSLPPECLILRPQRGCDIQRAV